MRRDRAACRVQRATCSVPRATCHKRAAPCTTHDAPCTKHVAGCTLHRARRLTVPFVPIVLAALTLSCSSPNQRATTPQGGEPAATDRQALHPVTLPNLSLVSPSVRLQLTEQYTSL